MRPSSRRFAAAPISVLLLGLSFGAAAAAPAAPTSLTLQPCEVPGVARKVRCGSLEVFENRTLQTGRRIPLKILVLPATGSDRTADPLVFLEGGPGAAATEDAPGFAQEFARILERRDILLVDQRGTGGSHPLNCTLFAPADRLESYLGEFFPLEGVKRCRPELERGSDLKRYTTPIAADDLDEVRAALGYEKLNLFGVSYGTRAALVYLRRHGAHVRTVTLLGVSPTDQDIPLRFPVDTERSLDGVLAECAADPACHAAFPDPKGDLRAALARLKADPATVEIVHPETGAPTTVRLSRDVAAEAIRYMLYAPESARHIPAVVHAAAAGDLAPITEIALYTRQHIVSSGSNGLYLSVTCAEDLPWIRPDEAERLAAGTMLGDYRYREQRADCAVWPRAGLPIGYRLPVHSKVPVLIVSGAWDPVTPPSNGTAVAKSLSRSLHVVVPHGGHSLEGLVGADCIGRLEADFIERGSAAGLDTRCVARIERPPFATDVLPAAPVALGESQLRRLAGVYATGDSTEARLEPSGGRLRLTISGGETLILVPVSQDRFRVAGEPLSVFRFELEGESVRRAVLENWGTVEMTLTPKR